MQRQNHILARRVDELCSNVDDLHLSVEALNKQNEKLLSLVSAIAKGQGHATRSPPLSPTASTSSHRHSSSNLFEKQTFI